MSMYLGDSLGSADAVVVLVVFPNLRLCHNRRRFGDHNLPTSALAFGVLVAGPLNVGESRNSRGFASWLLLFVSGQWPDLIGRQTVGCSPLLKLMDLLRVVSLVRGALDSNLYGLVCPFYCSPSSLPSLVLSFLLGFLCGVFCAGYFLLRWWGPSTLVPAPVPPAPKPTTLGCWLICMQPSEATLGFSVGSVAKAVAGLLGAQLRVCFSKIFRG